VLVDVGDEEVGSVMSKEDGLDSVCIKKGVWPVDCGRRAVCPNVWGATAGHFEYCLRTLDDRFSIVWCCRSTIPVRARVVC